MSSKKEGCFLSLTFDFQGNETVFCLIERNVLLGNSFFLKNNCSMECGKKAPMNGQKLTTGGIAPPLRQSLNHSVAHAMRGARQIQSKRDYGKGSGRISGLLH